MVEQNVPSFAPDSLRIRLSKLWHVIVMVSLILLMQGTLAFEKKEFMSTRASIKVYPLDSYFYAGYALNILHGKGPRTDWPSGPANKYFPGFSYWWSLFLSSNETPLEAVADHIPAQMILSFIIMIALALLGRLIWHDWIAALGFSALGSSSPILIKWLDVPMAEPLATACVTAFAASAMLVWRAGPLSPTPRRTFYVTGLSGMAFFGAAGFFTRMEVMYVVMVSVAVILLLKRIHWGAALAVIATTALPVVVWQVWAGLSFAQQSSYIAEGVSHFNGNHYFFMLAFLIEFFIRVPNVRSVFPDIDFVMLLASILFFAALVAGLRGYLTRAALVSAWLCVGYWILHAFWYYGEERYNLIILPFGFIVFFEGLGRLYNWRYGWKARGASIFLLIVCLLFVTYFRDHADMLIDAHCNALNLQVLPD